ncbi:hypothetical protein HDU76_004292 [Blyttiomyces sp. JEL0837]|nr:hypothetical protein HDU76_004292 [Blyttiomyces sp. JEL0837]
MEQPQMKHTSEALVSSKSPAEMSLPSPSTSPATDILPRTFTTPKAFRVQQPSPEPQSESESTKFTNGTSRKTQQGYQHPGPHNPHNTNKSATTLKLISFSTTTTTPSISTSTAATTTKSPFNILHDQPPLLSQSRVTRDLVEIEQLAKRALELDAPIDTNLHLTFERLVSLAGSKDFIIAASKLHQYLLSVSERRQQFCLGDCVTTRGALPRSGEPETDKCIEEAFANRSLYCGGAGFILPSYLLSIIDEAGIRAEIEELAEYKAEIDLKGGDNGNISPQCPCPVKKMTMGRQSHPHHHHLGEVQPHALKNKARYGPYQVGKPCCRVDTSVLVSLGLTDRSHRETDKRIPAFNYSVSRPVPAKSASIPITKSPAKWGYNAGSISSASPASANNKFYRMQSKPQPQSHPNMRRIPVPNMSPNSLPLGGMMPIPTSTPSSSSMVSGKAPICFKPMAGTKRPHPDEMESNESQAGSPSNPPPAKSSKTSETAPCRPAVNPSKLSPVAPVVPSSAIPAPRAPKTPVGQKPNAGPTSPVGNPQLGYAVLPTTSPIPSKHYMVYKDDISKPKAGVNGFAGVPSQYLAYPGGWQTTGSGPRKSFQNRLAAGNDMARLNPTLGRFDGMLVSSPVEVALLSGLGNTTGGGKELHAARAAEI